MIDLTPYFIRTHLRGAPLGSYNVIAPFVPYSIGPTWCQNFDQKEK